MSERSFIVGRRCDEPMARSKHLFPCNKNCRNCVACIERDQYGHEGHAVHEGSNETDYNLLARNLKIRGLYGILGD